MMIKHIKYIFFTLALFFCMVQLKAQEEQKLSLRERINQKKQAEQQESKEIDIATPQLSVRAQIRNLNNEQNVATATWQREVYRFLDLSKDNNGALYYPVTPIKNRINLYTMIFSLMAENKINAFEFNDSQDIFTDQYRVTPEEMMKRLDIPYMTEGNKLVYDDYNIPSADVKGYYIKEIWFFDALNSVVDIKIDAICPVLFRSDFDGLFLDEATSNGIREPQFWIPYENIRPYASQMLIMTSNLNNKLRDTIDDFFRLRLYKGEIYKVTNMQNKLLVEEYKTPEELKAAQEKIEQELSSFDKDLWVMSDSIKISNGNPKKKKKQKMDRPQGSSAGLSARERRFGNF